MIKGLFDTIECENANREFISATGTYHGKRLTVLSTGIGTDNIDIVMTELDALVNIDFKTRTPKETHTTLEIVRIGTSGSLQADLPVDSWLLSEAAIGFDGVLNYYAGRNNVADLDFEHAFEKHVDWNPLLAKPYVVNGNADVIGRLRNDPRIHVGTTISAPGFYGPQGRVVRLPLASPNLNEKITSFSYQGRRVTNYEMECSCIYGLSLLLGHKPATVCAIIANRLAGQYSKDYKPVVKALVEHVLNNL